MYKRQSAEWAPNEKVAAEVALGAAFAASNSLVTMKHVGFNVAQDLFFTASYSGIQGGMVAVVADDPGMASSQNEQDTRSLAFIGGLPVLEPVSYTHRSRRTSTTATSSPNSCALSRAR